jgi:tRNA (guanine-N7-)-methyltransferase
VSGGAAPDMEATSLWRAVFGNDRPVEVEIGSGTGTFLLQAARKSPQLNFYGIENARSRARLVEYLIARHNCANARIIAADAKCLLRNFVPPASVATFHIYFPDPWWKRRHHRRRLFTEELAADLERTLVPGGYVHTATDVADVIDLIRATMATRSAFVEDLPVRPPRQILTSFERKGIARGALIWEASFRKGG